LQKEHTGQTTSEGGRTVGFVARQQLKKIITSRRAMTNKVVSFFSEK